MRVLLLITLMLLPLMATPVQNGRPVAAPSILATTSPYIQEFPLPTLQAVPGPIAVAPNGTVWFAETHANSLAQFNPSTKKFTEFSIKNSSVFIFPSHVTQSIFSVTTDTRGNVWFTLPAANAFGYFNITNEAFTYYNLTRLTGRSYNSPYGISIDSIGLVWIAENAASRLGRLDISNGSFQEYPLIETSRPNTSPVEIFIDTNHKLWITSYWYNSTASGSTLTHFDPTVGQITRQYNLSAAGIFTPVGVVLDLNGHAWIGDHAGAWLGDVNTGTGEAKIHRTSLPPLNPNPQSLTDRVFQASLTLVNDVVLGSDGSPWFIEHLGARVGHYIPSNDTMVEYNIPTTAPITLWLAADQTGGLWFTEEFGNKLGYLNTNTATPAFGLASSSNISTQVSSCGSTSVVSIKNLSSNSINVTAGVENTPNFSGPLTTVSVAGRRSAQIPVEISSSSNLQAGNYTSLKFVGIIPVIKVSDGYVNYPITVFVDVTSATICPGTLIYAAAVSILVFAGLTGSTLLRNRRKNKLRVNSQPQK